MAVEYLPKLWSDMVIFDHTDRESLVVAVLSTMVKCQPPPESELTDKFCNIAWSVWEKIEGESDQKYGRLGYVSGVLGCYL